jgi:aryl-alcohol dehydrogenase-like predicted oxidoreductase
MKYRTLGRTGLRVSEVGFGTAPAGIQNYLGAWDPMAHESTAQFRNAVHCAIEHGYNFFDTAPAYGAGRAEELLGDALQGFRSRVVLATKCSWRIASQAETEDSVLESLHRLKTDHIDIIQLHGTYDDRFGSSDVQRVVSGPVCQALMRLKNEGVIRAIGITCEEASSLVPFVESDLFDTIQVKYNLLYQEAFHSLLPLCARKNVGVLVMRPASSGIFAKYLEHTDTRLTTRLSPSELSLNYVLSDTRVHSAIVGMRSVNSVKRNAELSDSEALRVDLNWLHERAATQSPEPWIQPL